MTLAGAIRPIGTLAALVLAASAVQGQTGAAPPGPRAQVLVLGAYHFDNPGLDLVKVDIPDVATPAKQAEVAAVVEALARFRPTKIAVEARQESARRLDSLYAAFRAGRHELARSEVQQLGFRLAHRFGHARVYPIDVGGDLPFDALMRYAAVHDTPFVARFQRLIGQIGAEQARMHRESSIGAILRAENDPSRIEWGHRQYVEMARVGAGDGYAGADVLAKWYERNIRIFANLQRLAEPGDRILVIFGAGHAAILRQLIAADSHLELLDVREFLPH
ncbi:MAG: DUF5694 domain-containing protein [Longimicrobiaceae bacterium]